MRVLVVDDHVLFREVFIRALHTRTEVQVVGEAGDVKTACERVGPLRPDLVTLDVMLDGESGTAAARELRKINPGLRILMLTGYPHVDQMLQAFANGALGYIGKAELLDDVIAAMRTVAAGHEHVPRQFAETLQEVRRGQRRWTAFEGLSRREREVFQLAARGLTNRGIAEALTISIKTVETHRTKIHRKLGTATTSDLVRVAVREGLPI
jgi:DNA-binding NarL/FixJ family response regulator